jgi:hypothetical protein
VRDTVLRQPHRNGDVDPFRESPLGRFVLKHELDRLCYDAALTYGRVAGRVFSSRGATKPILGTRPSTGNGKEMSAETARRLQGELTKLDAKLGKISRVGLRALLDLAMFEVEVSGEDEAAATVLRALI